GIRHSYISFQQVVIQPLGPVQLHPDMITFCYTVGQSIIYPVAAHQPSGKKQPGAGAGATFPGFLPFQCFIGIRTGFPYRGYTIGQPDLSLPKAIIGTLVGMHFKKARHNDLVGSIYYWNPFSMFLMRLNMLDAVALYMNIDIA